MVLFNTIAILVSTFLLFCVVLKISKSEINLVDICFLAVFLMQVVPLAFEFVFGIEDIKQESIYVYEAMGDTVTGFYYNLLTVISLAVLYLFRDTIGKKNNLTKVRFFLRGIRLRPFVSCSLLLFSFLLLLFGILLSPDRTVYLHFSYFYTSDLSRTSAAYAYHYSVMSQLELIMLGVVLLVYLLSSPKARFVRLIVYIEVFLLVWVDGKRGFLTYSLLGILMIDFMKKSYNSRILFASKSSLFLAIILSYFFVYSSVTGKGSGNSFFVEYSFYFSRLSVEKTAIYDCLHGKRILEYPLQSILYDLFFFVPRSWWPEKPVMYCRYFTGYAYTGLGSNMLTGNLQVNVWTEYISNFGIIGHLLALLLLLFVIRFLERKASPVPYIFGSMFILIYLMFGFESIVLVLYSLFVLSAILSKTGFSKASIRIVASSKLISFNRSVILDSLDSNSGTARGKRMKRQWL